MIKVPERDLTADVDAILAAVSPATRMVIIANPNNPTGSLLPQSEMERLRAGPAAGRAAADRCRLQPSMWTGRITMPGSAWSMPATTP